MNQNSFLAVGVILVLSYHIRQMTQEEALTSPALTSPAIMVILMAILTKILLNRRWTRW